MVLALLALSPDNTSCQDTIPVQTLFSKNTKPGYWGSPGLKSSSVQDKLGSLIELQGGLLMNSSIRAGLAGGVKFGPPEVNYGHVGLIGQYADQPNKMVHFAGQVFVTYGSTKDYESEKSSLFDNFRNIYGEGFYLIEPGSDIEVNLTERLRLSLGVSYRFVTGLDDESTFVSYTHVTNGEMSGLNIRTGLVFAGRKR
ncbi:MAG: hypothetical protein WAV93_03105 [Bacteroidales bacterium]